MSSLHDDEIAAFKDRIAVQDSGCIEWTGPRDDNGYGRFTFKRQQQLAHRAAFRLFCGEIPDGMCILHHCDNPPCVNVNHLFLGDRGDNARDMSAKGRQWLQQHPERRAATLTCPPEKKVRGEKHHNAVLTDQQVLTIRERAANGEKGFQLATEFGCSKSLLSQVIHGQIWAHVGGPIKPKRLPPGPAEIRKSIVAEAREKASPPTKAAQAGEPIAREAKPAKPVIAYTSPGDPRLTWTGKGKQPRWVTEFLFSEGNTLDMLRTPAATQAAPAAGQNQNSDRASPAERKPAKSEKMMNEKTAVA